MKLAEGVNERRRGRLAAALRRATAAALLAVLVAATVTARVSTGQPAAQASAGGGQGAVALKPGPPVKRELKGGEAAHLYQIKLAAGKFVRLSVNPRGGDLVLVLSVPGGRPVEEFKFQDGLLSPVAFVTEVSGAYGLEVRAQEKGAAAVRYTLAVEEIRAADARDKRRLAAKRAFAAGVQLQFEVGGAGDLRAAVEKYKEALLLWQSTGDRADEANALGSIADAYRSLREHRKAIEYYKKKLSLAGQANDRQQQAYMLELIGGLYFDPLREKREALENLQKALVLYREVGDRDGEAYTLSLIGRVYTKLGETPDERRKALGYHVEALAIYRAAGNRYLEGEALGNIMEAWKALDQPGSAIFFGKQAVNLFQEIRTGIRDLEKDTQKTFIKSREKTYRTLASLLISVGRLTVARQVLRMLKEEEYGYIRGESDETPPAIEPVASTTKEAEWEPRFREITDQVTALGRERRELLNKEARTPPEEQRLNELESKLILAYRAYEKFLDQLSQELGDSKLAKERLDNIRNIEALVPDLPELGSGVVILCTLVTEEKYRVILFTPDSEKVFEYPIKGEELAFKVIAFREALEDRGSDPIPLAQELYKILVGPVAKDLEQAKAETLMWSLDGVLRHVPVTALHDGNGYMIERYRNVVFTPASSTRLKDVPGKWSGLGFGVSKAHGDLIKLPAVPAELRSIIRDEALSDGAEGLMPGKVFLDDTFTEESLRTMLRNRYPVVHIASHFIFKPGDKANSFLLLGDGQHLSLSQIESSVYFNGVELLTLSACDTATGGDDDNGKEVEGFADVAQRRGAKSVVASLWSVDDSSTQLLMTRFYRERGRPPGLPKAEALRQAQLSLLQGGGGGVSRGNTIELKPRALTGSSAERGIAVAREEDKTSFRHPYFWAPFMLIGNFK